MGTSKRERQKLGHRARLNAERAADARYRRRRQVLVAALGVFVVVVVVGGIVALSRSDGTSSAAASTTTTSIDVPTTVGLESAAGKPCVAFDDTLPAGAPEVPVPVGAPPTTLVTEDLVVGSGTEVAATDTVTVQYIGVSCSTGKIFDSSWQRGTPATFPLDQVIAGWTEGIPGMQPGGRRLLVIPPDLGYGSQQSGEIAPDETLVFVVDLVSSEATAAADPSSTATTVP